MRALLPRSPRRRVAPRPLLTAALAAVALMATVLPVVGAAPAGAQAEDTGPSARPTALLVGDSVLAGVSLRPDSTAIVTERYDAVVDGAVCRRLVVTSCSYQGRRPPPALQVLDAWTGPAPDVVVMMVGYNEAPIDAAATTILDRLAAMGVGAVVWPTYRVVPSHPEYAAHNRTLTRLAAERPELSLADWNAHSAGRSDWVAADGLHVTTTGADALARFLVDAMDDALAAAAPLDRCRADDERGTEAAEPAGRGPAGTGVGLHPVTPTRLLDTRDGAPVGARRTVRVPVAGVGSIPGDATAALVTLTAVDACAEGYLTVHACLDPPPLASNVNQATGETRANLAFTSLDDDGALCVTSHRRADVLVDLVAWGGPGDGGVGLTAVAPRRVVDTRRGTGGTRLGAGEVRTVVIPDAPTGATGALVNLTVTDPADAGYLTAYPAPAGAACGAEGRPVASNVNHAPGQTVAATASVGVATDDGRARFCLYAHRATDVVVDHVGWLAPGADRLAADGPDRLLDTRRGGIALAGDGRLGRDQVVTLDLGGEPGSARLVNLTAVGAGGPGFVTAFPADGDGACRLADAPVASTVNTSDATAIPNLAVVALGGEGRVCLRVSAAMHLVADLAGRAG